MTHMTTETRLDLCCRIKAVLATLPEDAVAQIARTAGVDHYPLTADGWGNTDRAQIRAMGDGIREGTGKRRHMEDKGVPWKHHDPYTEDEFDRVLQRYTPVTCPDHGEGGE